MARNAPNTLPLAVATTVANSTQAHASSTAAQDNAIVPNRVFSSPESQIIHANIGNAVMATAAATNRPPCQCTTLSVKYPPRLTMHHPTTPPSTRGTPMPAAEVTPACLTCAPRMSSLNDAPTRNM